MEQSSQKKTMNGNIIDEYQNIIRVVRDQWPQIILKNLWEMSNDTPKPEISSVSSKSFDPGLRDIQASNIFGGRKSSFDFVNILKDSDQLPHRDIRNSLDILMSNINGTNPQQSMKNISHLYNNDQQKAKIQQSGVKLIDMQEVHSESEEVVYVPQAFPLQVQPVRSENLLQPSPSTYFHYFEPELASVLSAQQIPLYYLRSMMQIKNQKEIKSTRRLKVERYLEKRRMKTWNRKICYNCRQKVAEQRLRIKGKFIKKRRAMEILGITTPIDMGRLKDKLEALLKNKSNDQIDRIIKMQE